MITREEYGWLNIYRSEGFRWIIRDKNKWLYVYDTEPEKRECEWRATKRPSNADYIEEGYRLFPNVKWEDEKPAKIDDLIRDYESHKVITGGNNVNKAELIKEIEDIFDDIGVSDYQLGESSEDDCWLISSITIRKIFSAIEKYSPDGVKVTVPQFVADWIEEVKALKRSFKLEFLFDTTEMPDDVYYWLDDRYGDTDILAKAWLDGYEVEKEKLYTVQLKNGYHLCKYEGTGVRWLNMTEFNKADCYKLTQAEIESVDPVLMKIAEEVE